MSYTDALDKLDAELDILDVMLLREMESPEHMDLVVQQSKRVRTASSLLVRALAAHRDTYSPRAQGDAVQNDRSS